MELAKGDIEALARFRAGKGKFMLGMLVFIILWVLATLVIFYQMIFNREMLMLAIIGVSGIFLWLAVFIVISEAKTKELVVKLKEEYEKDIKS